MAEIESSTLKFGIESEVKGTDKIERLAETFEDTGNAAEEAGKAAKAAGEEIANSTSKASKAIEVMNGLLEKSKAELLKDIVDSRQSKIQQMIESGKFSKGDIAKQVMLLQKETADYNKAMSLPSGEDKMSPERAKEIAEQTSQLEILRQKIELASQKYTELFNKGANADKLNSALRSVKKAQDDYNKALEESINAQKKDVMQIVSPEQANEFANSINRLTLLKSELDNANAKLAQYIQNRMLGDTSVENNQRINSWITKVQSIQAKLEKAMQNSASFKYAEGLKQIGHEAEASSSSLENFSRIVEEINAETASTGSSPLAGTTAGDEVVAQFQAVPTVFDRITDAAQRGTSAIARFAAETGSKAAGKVADFARRCGDVVNAFKRIAFYRFIRTVIKEITEGFREGVNNVYQWSKALGGEFAASMDRAATASLYLKNSLGAMLAPAINALVPILDVAIDAFVRFINIVNQAIALITGAASWTRAKKYPTEYAKAVSSGAGKAADALHKLGLAQIDELTILDGKHGNTGSGGGGADGLDYSQMFEQVDTFNKKLQDLIGKMKINFHDVLFKWDNLTPEDIAKKAIAGLGAFLGGAAGFIIGGVPGAIIGTLLGGTLGIMIDSLIFDNDGVLSRREIGEMLRLALFTLAGGAIGFAVGGVGGALIGATIGMTIYGAIKGFEFFTDKSADSFMKKLTPVLGAASGGIIGAKIGGALGGAAGGAAGGLIGAVIGLTLGFAIENFAFSDTANWGAGDWAKAIVQTIAPAAGAAIGFFLGGGIPGAIIGAAIGTGLSFSLEGFSFEDMAKWTGEDWANAIIKVIAPAAGAMIGFSLGGVPGALIGMAIGLGINFLLKTDIVGQADKYGQKVNETVGKHIAKTQSDVDKFGQDAQNTTSKAMGGISSTVGSGLLKTNTDVNLKTNTMERTLAQSWNSIKQTASTSWSGIVSTIGQWIEKAKQKLNFSWKLPEVKLPHIPTPHFSLATGVMGVQFPHFDGWWANGGFPEKGSLFIANEAGAEMVGSMGGRTAVANNDQIVEGIRAGVYDAVTAAMANGGQSVNVYLDGKQISGTVVNNINSETRRTGSSPLLSY